MDANFFDMLWGSGADAIKAEQAIADEARARALIDEQGGDWEEIITEVFRVTSWSIDRDQRIAAAIEAFRRDNILPKSAIDHVIYANRPRSGGRPTEWELRGRDE